jgi:hypothetical protein
MLLSLLCFACENPLLYMYQLKAGIKEPEETALVKQHLNTFQEQQARTRAQLCMVFSMHPVSYQMLNMQWYNSGQLVLSITSCYLLCISVLIFLLHGLSPRANYTDQATAACRQSDCQLLQIESATWSAWRIPTAVFSVSRQEPLLFYQVAPQLYSRGWVHPIPDPLLFFFLVVPGIEPGPPDL